MKILLIEDTPQQQQEVLSALRIAIGSTGQAELFESSSSDDEKTYEERLHNELSEERYQDVTLIVADRDLSKTNGYTGLSESVVRRVADQLGIPECFYARNAGDNEMVRAHEREAFIAVSMREGVQACANRLVAIAQGFEELKAKLKPELNSTKKQPAGKTLAKILGKDEYADKIALYASGDRNRPGHVMHMSTEDARIKLGRLTCLFGYWLWDSILQYPGVVVNEIAAASYLNISPEYFAQPDIRRIFDSALYAGPFAKAMEPRWWRGLLHDLVVMEQFEDGRKLVEATLKRQVSPCACKEDSSQNAGYYCMLTEQPVSLKNSRPGLAWFPRGADLARVSNSAFEELGPWL